MIIFDDVLDQGLINIVDIQILLIMSIQLDEPDFPHNFVYKMDFGAVFLVSKCEPKRHVHEIVYVVQNQGIAVRFEKRH